MRLGLGSYAFRWSIGTPAFRPDSPATLADVLDETAKLGCSLLQIADSVELEAMSISEMREFRAHAEDLGVRLQTGTSGLTNERMLRYLAITGFLGGSLVRLVLDSDDARPGRVGAETILRSLAGRFEDEGVVIAIENHFLIPSPELVEIIENVASPALGVCLDTANSVMIGEWPRATIELLSPFALCMHLKDYAVIPDENGVGGHVVGKPLGEGSLDIQGALAAVRPADERLHGELAVVLEQWLPLHEDPKTTVEEERRWRELNVARAEDYLVAARGVAGPDDETRTVL
jgi:sugar phosphate isomerase/epimerase